MMVVVICRLRQAAASCKMTRCQEGEAIKNLVFKTWVAPLMTPGLPPKAPVSNRFAKSMEWNRFLLAMVRYLSNLARMLIFTGVGVGVGERCQAYAVHSRRYKDLNAVSAGHLEVNDRAMCRRAGGLSRYLHNAHKSRRLGPRLIAQSQASGRWRISKWGSTSLTGISMYGDKRMRYLSILPATGFGKSYLIASSQLYSQQWTLGRSRIPDSSRFLDKVGRLERRVRGTNGFLGGADNF